MQVEAIFFHVLPDIFFGKHLANVLLIGLYKMTF